MSSWSPCNGCDTLLPLPAGPHDCFGLCQLTGLLPCVPARSKVLAVSLISWACIVCSVLVLRTLGGICRLKVRRGNECQCFLPCELHQHGSLLLRGMAVCS